MSRNWDIRRQTFRPAGLDNNPPQRVAYVLPRREGMLLAGRENVSMYEPMAGQLQSPTEIQPPITLRG
ncbi:30S ribosomal protein S4 related protein [Klebsiella michiganensis]|uniref:30S ribosomal protein S4 related protein n=1 Tax=Klebsiella michiganensis TaxID=1134687 RepID=A0A7H4N5M8_9ENTR|nr:30S ribosomal protein S4 related protein [Klebsiella michiganensis]